MDFPLKYFCATETLSPLAQIKRKVDIKMYSRCNCVNSCRSCNNAISDRAFDQCGNQCNNSCGNQCNNQCGNQFDNQRDFCFSPGNNSCQCGPNFLQCAACGVTSTIFRIVRGADRFLSGSCGCGCGCGCNCRR